MASQEVEPDSVGMWRRVDDVSDWLIQEGVPVVGPVIIQRVGIGQSNLTSIVTDAAGFSCVLREPPQGASGTAHDMGREMRMLDALAGSAVPVPTVLARGAFPDGRAYYAMTRLPGDVLVSEQDAERLPWAERASIGRGAVEVLGCLHSIDPRSIGLEPSVSRTPYVERQIRRMEQAWEHAGGDSRHDASWERLTDALKQSLPDGPARESVIHGDYRISNLLVEAGAVVGVLDWELSTVGDPLVDLAWLLEDWRGPGDLATAMPAPTRAGGFGSREELVEIYAQVTGDDPDRGGRLALYRALASWRAAALLLGVVARRRAGVMGEATGPATVDLEKTIGLQLETGLELVGRRLP